MSRIAYVNGRYLPAARRATVHIEDRGYQFADGVYEVCEVSGRPSGRRAPSHGAACSARSTNCGSPCRCRRRRSARSCARPCARNRVRDGIVYLQVTRGVARRDHAFPPAGDCAQPGGDGAHASIAPATEQSAAKGIAVVTVPDNRWDARRHQDRSRCCPTCWPSRRRASRAPARPGSSMRTGMVTEGVVDATPGS